MSIKTRFPPSPTGYLHVGSLRTALYNYYFARQQNGKFLLRVEDTDRSRYVEGSIESLIRTMDQMGIDYDEGPVLNENVLSDKGELGPYLQSNRLDIYAEHAQRLLQSGHAYTCFCTKERLGELRLTQQAAKQPTKYDRACLQLSEEEKASRVAAGEAHVIRMLIPEGKTTFQDEVRGSVTIDHQEIDDQVLIKADGFPTYHLAVVVDDHAMKVTHVIRGEEWISSVPKHVLLYEWFGFELPVFAHLPLILNPDKSKLSKRQGDVSVEDFLAKGFVEEALINFVSLLGFNPSADREIYSKQELIELFDLKKINKGGAVFDINKLLWMNGQYISSFSASELATRVQPFLSGEGEVSQNMLERICEIEKTRMTRLTDIQTILGMYIAQPSYGAEMLVWKKSDKEDALIQLNSIQTFFQSTASTIFDSTTLIDETIKRYIGERELQNGNVLWPLRVALSGSERSAGPHELIWILGQAETIARIEHAKTLLS